MLRLSEFGRYLSTRNGRVSLALVLAFAAVLACFCGRASVAPLPKSYPLDFGRAEWISAPTPSQGYFRQTLYLDARIDRAWIQIASPDSFELSVNGVPLGARMFEVTMVAGMYDLKKVLQPGKNVIAIHVERSSYPGAAQLLVRGAYTLAGSPPHEFFSDTTWKVSTIQPGIVGGLTWRSPLLDDRSWPDAQRGDSAGRPGAVMPLEFPPFLLEKEPMGLWIAPPQSGAPQASFRTTFHVPRNRGETWLQIAATGLYDVMVNGHLAINEPLLPGFNAGQPGAVPTLQAYNITPWVTTGDNTLLLRVHSEIAPTAILVDGVTFQADGNLRFGTNTTWKTTIAAAGPPAGWRDDALVLGHLGDAPWGTLLQSVATPYPLPTEDLRMILIWSALFLATVAVVVFLWLASCAFCSSRTGHPIEELWTADALSHFFLLSILLFFLLLTFDIRFLPDWCYSREIVVGVVAAFLASKALLLIDRAPRDVQNTGHTPPPSRHRRPYLIMAALGVLMLWGGALRFPHLSDISLDFDEMSVIRYADGIFIDGFPHIHPGSFYKQMATYEIVSYPLAAAKFLLGNSEFGLRFPSALFGTLTIGLIGLAGYRAFDWRVGLTAALVYVLSPSTLYWSTNAFWPSQGQMFVVLTVWLFYEGIQTRPFRAGFLTAATASFVCGYLTWEGTGFLLPCLFLAMLFVNWGDYHWLKDWHLWRCLFIMTVVVVLQLSHRQLTTIPMYLQVGANTTEVTSPEIVYVDPTKFDPTYYLKFVLFWSSNYVMSLFLFGGLLFCWGDKRTRYFCTVCLTAFSCYTFLLPAYSTRYSYPPFALLILCAVIILFQLVDRAWQAGRSITSFAWPGLLSWCGSAVVVLVLVLASNEYILKPYRLSDTGKLSPSARASGSVPKRMGLYRADIRGAARFVNEQRKPGDAVVLSIPYVHFYYEIKDARSLASLLNYRIAYEGAGQKARFIDKGEGIPMLRSLADLDELRGRYARIWAVLVPEPANDTQNPEVNAYVTGSRKFVYESYGVQVVLLEGTQQTTPQN